MCPLHRAPTRARTRQTQGDPIDTSSAADVDIIVGAGGVGSRCRFQASSKGEGQHARTRGEGPREGGLRQWRQVQRDGGVDDPGCDRDRFASIY